MASIVFIILGKSAKTAVLLSLFIPGGGQFYTESYIKGVIFSGAQGFLMYSTYTNYMDYNQAKLQLERGEIEKVEYDYRRAVFYDNLWWDGLVWFLSLVDAYIDAKLYNFRNLPEVGFSKRKITLTWTF